MTAIRNTQIPVMRLPASRQSGTAAETAPSRVETDIADLFERAATRKDTLVAGNPVGAAAAMILNLTAIWTGASNTLTGFDTHRGTRHTQLPRTELVRRGLNGGV